MFSDDEIKAALKLTEGDVAAAAELMAGGFFDEKLHPAVKEYLEFMYDVDLDDDEEKKIKPPKIFFSDKGQSLIFWVVLNYLFKGVKPDGSADWNVSVPVFIIAKFLREEYPEYFKPKNKNIDVSRIPKAVITKIQNTKASITKAVADDPDDFMKVVHDYQIGLDIGQRFATYIDGTPWVDIPDFMKRNIGKIFNGRKPYWDPRLSRG